MAFKIVGRENPTLSEKVGFRITGRESPQRVERVRHPSPLVPTEEEREQLQYPYYAGSVLTQHPLQTLAQIPIDIIGGAEHAGRLISSGETGSPLADYLSNLTGFSELPDEAQEAGHLLGAVLSLLPELSPELSQVGKALGNFKNIGKGSLAGIPEAASLAAGETSSLGSDLTKLGKSIKEGVLGKNLSKTVPEVLSAERIENTTKAGMKLEKNLQANSKKDYQIVNKNYRVSDSLNKPYEKTHPEIAQDFLSKISEWKQIADPSPPLQKALNGANKMLSKIAEVQDGQIIGYKPISNNDWIKQIEEWNHSANFEFPHGSPTGELKYLISKANEAVDSSASALQGTSEGKKAWNSWQKAKKSYADWQETYRNPVASKWGRLEDKAYSKNYSNLGIDELRQLKEALIRSPEGRIEFQMAKRELAEKMLEDFYSLGGKFEKAQIEKQLSELEAVFESSEIEALREAFQKARTPGARIANIGIDLWKAFKRPGSALTRLKNVQ